MVGMLRFCLVRQTVLRLYMFFFFFQAEDGIRYRRHPRDGLRPPGRRSSRLHGPGRDRRDQRPRGVFRRAQARADEGFPEPDLAVMLAIPVTRCSMIAASAPPSLRAQRSNPGATAPGPR